MTLLAQYVRTHTADVLDLQLLEIETKGLALYITDAEGDEANDALINLARRWAHQNGHTIAEIDTAILNVNAAHS